MVLILSSYTEGPTQADGCRYVDEQHIINDGRVFNFNYLCDQQNPQIVMEERAKVIEKTLLDREAAILMVVGTEVPLTKYEFLSRFTPEERKSISAEAKVNADIEDFMLMLDASGGDVYLTLARPGLQGLVSYGKLTPDRAIVIGTD